MRRIVVLCGLAALAVGAWANVRLPNVFSDNMMLQRKKPIAVWGWAAPAEAVRVQLAQGGTELGAAQTTANAAGEWQVTLPALEAGEGLELRVAGTNTLTLKHLILGDIWVCSGQSNMEMTLAACNSPEDVTGADFPKIRRVKIERTPATAPSQDVPRPVAWQVCTPHTAGFFTAAGFYFAREVFQQTGVPIGLLDVNWGGTAIEAWLPLDYAGGVPEMAALRSKTTEQITAYRQTQLPGYVTAMDAWSTAARAALAANTELPPLPAAPAHPIGGGMRPTPFSLYNGMIHPLLRVPMTGVLWYQGEANAADGDQYFAKMRDLIGAWRARWGQGDFPFYYVQLANFMAATDNPAGGDGYARIRCAQAQALTIPHTGMASAVDIGEAGNIHPKNKYDVGVRLARWALANEYGKTLTPGGPIFTAATVEGGKMRLTFTSVGAGLMVGKKVGRAPAVEDAGGTLARFAIAGEDKTWHWADAVIDGNTVVVSSAQVPHPVAVRYAFSMNPDGANLYNRDGLPASPFRTDRW